MKVQHRSKVLRSITDEGLKHLQSLPNQQAQVLDVLRQIQRTKEFFGPERRIDTKVRIPETWTELRESLRNLTPQRNYGIELIYRGKCRGCGGRFNAASPRKRYCSNECEKKAEYQTRLEQGDFKKGMARTHQRKRQAAYDRTVKREQRRKEKQTHKAKSLYLKVVFENLNKKEEWRYNRILRLLGGKDEAKGHNKIVSWYKDKLKFAQIPAEDQKIFITWIHEQSQKQ